MNYIRIQTSSEVYHVIRARHTDLCVFSSFTDTDGTCNDGTVGRMETEYAFLEASAPILKIKTTWNIALYGARENIKHEYWLCVPDYE